MEKDVCQQKRREIMWNLRCFLFDEDTFYYRIYHYRIMSVWQIGYEMLFSTCYFDTTLLEETFWFMS